MNPKIVSILQGSVLAIVSMLVTLGVMGGKEAPLTQALPVGIIVFAAAVAIHSMLPPKE